MAARCFVYLQRQFDLSITAPIRGTSHSLYSADVVRYKKQPGNRTALRSRSLFDTLRSGFVKRPVAGGHLKKNILTLPTSPRIVVDITLHMKDASVPQASLAARCKSCTSPLASRSEL